MLAALAALALLLFLRLLLVLLLLVLRWTVAAAEPLRCLAVATDGWTLWRWTAMALLLLPYVARAPPLAPPPPLPLRRARAPPPPWPPPPPRPARRRRQGQWRTRAHLRRGGRARARRRWRIPPRPPPPLRGRAPMRPLPPPPPLAPPPPHRALFWRRRKSWAAGIEGDGGAGAGALCERWNEIDGWMDGRVRGDGVFGVRCSVFCRRRRRWLSSLFVGCRVGGGRGGWTGDGSS